MKNKAILCIILFLALLTLNSCKNSEKNNSLQNEYNNIEKPSSENIKKDIIGSEIENWRFDKIEEIQSINILNTDTSGANRIVYSVNIKLIDINTGRDYNCSAKIGYLLINKNQWKFQYLNGSITDADKYDIEEQSMSDSKSESRTSSETNNSYPICIGCNKIISDYNDIVYIEPYHDQNDNIDKCQYLNKDDYESIGEQYKKNKKGPFHNNCGHNFYNENKSSYSYKYPICKRCGNEIRSTVYYVNGVGRDYKVSTQPDNWNFNLYKYHQNCAEDEADYKNRNH